MAPSSDIEVVTERVGDGVNFPKMGQTVSVHYTATALTEGGGGGKGANNGGSGGVLDSTYPRGRPFCFKLGCGAVFKGWEEAVLGLSLGECATVTLPASLMYGARGFEGLVPPGAAIRLRIELVSIT